MNVRSFFSGNRAYMIALIICALFNLILMNFKYPEDSYDQKYFVAAIAMIVAAVALISIPGFTMPRSVAVLTFLYAILMILTSSVRFKGFENAMAVSILIATLGRLAAIALMVISVMYFFGIRSNGPRILYIVCLYVVCCLIPVVFNSVDIFHEFRLISFHDLMVKYSLDLGFLLYSAIILAMMFHRENKFTSDVKALRLSVRRLDSIRPLGHGMRIFRAQAPFLLSDDGWEDIDKGCVVSQKRVPVYLEGKDYELIFSRWEDGRMFGEVQIKDSPTHVQSPVFRFREMCPNGGASDCTEITVFGEEGVFFKIFVEEDKCDANYRLFQRIIDRILHLEEGYERA